MARAINTTMRRRKAFRGRTISPTPWRGRNSMRRKRPALSARLPSGWIIGQNSGQSGQGRLRVRNIILLAVGAGGAVGSMARYLVAGWLQPASWNGFPYGILVVNITGGLAMGILTEALALRFNVS